jgi:hypothetical protein
VAASLFGLWSGGTFATVHTNQLVIAATTATRSSLRRRITSGARPGRTSTKADPAAKTALTRSPTGAESKRQGAEQPEDDEVRPVVLEVRVELFAKQQRCEADERQGGGGDARCHQDGRTHPSPVRPQRRTGRVALFVPLLIRVCWVDNIV